MNINEILQRGQTLGIAALEERSKGDMIRAIQLAEGSNDCFGNLYRFDCLEFDCCWREDCRTVKPG